MNRFSLIDGNKIQNNTLDKQSVSAYDSSPVDMQTPEEFKAKVWRCGAKGSPRAHHIAFKKRGTAACVYVSEPAALKALAMHQVAGEPYECALESAIAAAFQVNHSLILVDELLSEIDRWEYKS